MTTTAAKPRRWGDLLPRVLSAIVLVGLALGTAALGGHVFAAFWLLAGVAVLWEWQRLIGPARRRPRVFAGAIALAMAAALAAADFWLAALGVLAAGLAATGLLADAGLRRMAAAGVLYAGAPVLSVILLRAADPFGPAAILWLFAVVWGTDVMAYFGGRLIGGPKLWPRLSPAKTWSGFLVGVGCGALAGLAVAPAGSPAAVFGVGVLAGVLAQGGDLLESMVKRRYGVKDSSRLIPGHGGAMDRLDGFIVAAVLAALLGLLHGGAPATAALGLFRW